MLLSKYFGPNTDRTGQSSEFGEQKATNLRMMNSNTNTDSVITNSNPDLLKQNRFAEINAHYNEDQIDG